MSFLKSKFQWVFHPDKFSHNWRIFWYSNNISSSSNWIPREGKEAPSLCQERKHKSLNKGSSQKEITLVSGKIFWCESNMKGRISKIKWDIVWLGEIVQGIYRQWKGLENQVWIHMRLGDLWRHVVKRGDGGEMQERVISMHIVQTPMAEWEAGEERMNQAPCYAVPGCSRITGAWSSALRTNELL